MTAITKHSEASAEGAGLTGAELRELVRRVRERRDRFAPYSVPWCRFDSVLEDIETIRRRGPGE